MIDAGVDSICVCLLFSFRNPAHEKRIGEIAADVMKEKGRNVSLLLSCDHNPVRGELPRMQTLILEAYAATPCRAQVNRIRDVLREKGSEAPLRVLTCYGGSIPPDHEWMVSTLISGPIGGMTGAKYLADELGLQNVVCSDVGGTSFDVGIISEGRFALEVEPAIARMKLALPSIVMDSIGAGTGLYVRLDPVIRRVELGPDSAGFKIGMSVAEETPTLNDCNLLLGYLNPDYFLGGEVALDIERARRGVKEQISDPLGISVEEAAAGVIELVNTQMRDHLGAMILGRGFSPEIYTLFSYGGAGPLHAYGYVEGLSFENVLVPSWAAAFSAFGCACADYTFRYDQQLDFPLSPGLEEAEALAELLNSTWAGLKDRIQNEMTREGLSADKMTFQSLARIQYQGQLDDLELSAPAFPMTADDVQVLIRTFEEIYGRFFPTASKSPELGFLITRVVAQGVLLTEKPVLKKETLGAERPPDAARKGKRPIFWRGDWIDAELYEMDRLAPGNRVCGPSVIEAPATTLLLPPGYETKLNAYRIFEVCKSS